MGLAKKTIRDIDITGKRLLIRVDYSVDVDRDGQIVDDAKLRATLPTVRYALEQGAGVVLCSHMGRPGGVFSSNLSLFPVAKQLRQLLGVDVDFVPECVGERATKAKQAVKPGQVLLLENLRFDSREEANDEMFAAELAQDIDLFVQDGFAVAYRKHASVDAITHQLPSVAGLLVEREITMLSSVFSDEVQHPLVVIVGGGSVAEKVHIIERAIMHADVLVLGGVIGTTFLHQMGVKTGKTPLADDDVALTRTLLDAARRAHSDRGFTLYVPQDAVVAAHGEAGQKTRIVDWGAHVIADIEAYPKRPLHESSQVMENEYVLDVGPFTGAYIAGLVQFADTVLWDGVLGDVTVRGHTGPVGPFAHGSELVLEALTGQFGRRPRRVIAAGDDTASFINDRGVASGFEHVSTGGGASLELLAGRSIIGVDALENT